MKPIKKKTAKLFIALIIISAVIGALFTFVPMNFGDKTFLSFSGGIKISSDIGAGVYAEYDLDGDFSENQINNSISIIKGVLEDKGYAGANIFSIADEKIRIEIGYPLSSSSLKESYTLLNAIGIGVFELRSSSSEEDTYINGKDHIKSVEINNVNSSVFVVLNFNKKGEKAYAQLLEDADSIYVCMGGETMTSFESNNATASSSLPLTFAEYASAQDFAMKVKLGSMDVNLNPETVVINTMSGTLNTGKVTANPNDANFNVNVTRIVTIVAIALITLLGIGYMIFKHGVLGAFTALALLFDTFIAILVMWALPWIEISFSSIIALVLGYSVVLASSLYFASLFEDEYKQGKTVSASFEGAFKKSLKGVLSTGIALTIIFGIVAIVANAELRVFGLITCIFACLSMFSTLIMLPGFIKIFEAFNDGAFKPYRLPKREDN